MKKKLFVFFMIVGMTIPVFAHGHHHHHGNDGIRLATDIVNLVGAGFNLIIPRPVVVAPAPVIQPTVIAPAPVVQPTVVVPPPVSYVPAPVAPVYTYPVVSAPPPRPIHYSEYRGCHPPPRRHPHPGSRHHRR